MEYVEIDVRINKREIRDLDEFGLYAYEDVMREYLEQQRFKLEQGIY